MFMSAITAHNHALLCAIAALAPLEDVENGRCEMRSCFLRPCWFGGGRWGMDNEPLRTILLDLCADLGFLLERSCAVLDCAWMLALCRGAEEVFKYISHSFLHSLMSKVAHSHSWTSTSVSVYFIWQGGYVITRVCLFVCRISRSYPDHIPDHARSRSRIVCLFVCENLICWHEM